MTKRPLGLDAIAIAKLAALDSLEYDRQRVSEAERLGVRPSALDQEVRRACTMRRGNGSDSGNDPRPLLRFVPEHIAEVVDQIEDVLVRSGAPVYQRGLDLVRPGKYEIVAADGKPAIAAGLRPLSVHGLIDEVDRVSRWQKWDGRSAGFKVIEPSREAALVLLARAGKWRLPSIAGIITCPTLRPDGSVLDTPGYDSATRLFLMADPGVVLPPVPAAPTRGDAEAALALLRGLLKGFPFRRPVDEVVALSLIVTAVVRGGLLIVPIHSFTAPTPGTGKSFIVDVVSVIVSGRPCPVIAPGSSAEELEKRLGGMLLAGYPLISLDNCSVALRGDALCQIATQRFVRIRVLTKSDVPEMEFRGILTANGNNLVVDDDLVRRVLLGQLDAGVERPEMRSFAFDPVAQVMADRGRYVAAAMVIVRAYLAARMPGVLRPIASFETWSAWVRSALVWLGCADPWETSEEVRANAPVLTDLRVVLTAWHAAFGCERRSVHQVIEAVQGTLLNRKESDPERLLFRALVAVAPGARGQVIDPIKLGRWLKRYAGRPVSGLRFVSDGIAHGGGVAWRIVADDQDIQGGNAGTRVETVLAGGTDGEG